jgi:hypothetical protein
MRTFRRELILLLLGFCLSGAGRDRIFEGTWAVDMAAEERSSDTGPFFDTFCLREDQAGIYQDMHLVSRMKEGENLSLFYPRNGAAGVATVNGKDIFTSSHRDGASLALLWRDSVVSERFLKFVLTVSPGGRTLTLSIFTHHNQTKPDQVVVLRRVNKTGGLVQPKSENWRPM